MEEHYSVPWSGTTLYQEEDSEQTGAELRSKPPRENHGTLPCRPPRATRGSYRSAAGGSPHKPLLAAAAAGSVRGGGGPRSQRVGGSLAVPCTQHRLEDGAAAMVLLGGGGRPWSWTMRRLDLGLEWSCGSQRGLHPAGHSGQSYVLPVVRRLDMP